MMKFKWDETKRLINIQKHAVDFRDATAIFSGYIITIEDDRFDYGERRFITIGLLNERIIVVVHTEREETIRIISARKATKYEQITYYRHVAN